MKPSRKLPQVLLILCLGFLLQHLNGAMAVQAQQVQVTAATPASTEQGTVNLNVKVNGKGFKNGAKAKWFITGTTDTGGVTVNSTTFVSSSEVTANITVSDTAVIANFDIQVLNSDGRGGKGTELFRVTAKGQALCPAQAPPPTGDMKCYAALPGCLDASFGGIGFVHTNPDNEDSEIEAQDIVVQPDGKIVIAGTAYSASTLKDFAVIRYNADGSLDTSFGDFDFFNPPLRLGYTVTAVSAASDWTRAVVLQPDGKIIVSGTANGNVVVRYNADGTLDSGFGSGGIVYLCCGAASRDLALQADGKILTGGYGFSVARLLPNGSLDPSFGLGGVVQVNPGGKRGSAWGMSLAIQRVPAITGEERIVLAGYSRTSTNDNTDWTLMRFRSNGATDTSFGNNGIVKTGFSGFTDQAREVRIDSGNRIVVAGLVQSASSDCGYYVSDYGLVRYTQDGSIDGSFSGGKQLVDVYGGSDNLHGLALQADGRILLFGHSSAWSAPLNYAHFSLVRFNVDGSRDASFGLLGDGIVITDLYGYGNYGFALALQPSDGKIIAAGSAYLAPASTHQGDIVVARYLP